MNITLLHTDSSVTRVDIERYIDMFFPTDRCMEAFEHGYGQDIWQNHVKKYGSRVVKVVLIKGTNSGIEFDRGFVDIIRFLQKDVLLQMDVVVLDNVLSVKDIVPFTNIIEPNSKYADLLDMSCMNPEEGHDLQRKMDYLRTLT